MSELKELIGGPRDGSMEEPVQCNKCGGEECDGGVMSYTHSMMSPDGRSIQVHVYDFNAKDDCWYWQGFSTIDFFWLMPVEDES